MNTYRHPSETWILVLTLTGMGIFLLLTSIPTLCLSPLFVLLLVFLSYQANQSFQRKVIQAGVEVDPQSTPDLYPIVETCRQRLNCPPVRVYILNNRERNAFTFGFSHPNTIVLHSSLLKIMDADELAFIIGHEMGHIVFNHTWLNTLIGGMSGVPMPFGAAIVFVLAFRSWNRACEYSSDRAGLIACGRLDKSMQALIEVAAGDVNTASEIQAALQILQQQQEQAGSQMGEFLSTHPHIAKRIHELREFARTLK